MADLGPFLAAAGNRRRLPGEWDCCTFPAAWALECGRPDPMAPQRGTYSSEAEAEQLIADAGGLDKLFAAGMASAGIPSVDGADYAPGDIGVVRLFDQEAGAVFTGRRWAFVAERGMAFITLDAGAVAQAWRPAHG